MDHIKISLNSKENILKVLYMKKFGSLSTWTQFQAPIISYIVHMGKKNAPEKEQSACIRFNDYEFMHIIILLV